MRSTRRRCTIRWSGSTCRKGGIGPGVARSWELAEDGSTWTFHLRPGQKFHNGDPLTAQDVKFSLQRQMAPNSIAAAAATMRRTIKSIDVVDDLTVNINTNTPQIGLPPSLSRAVAPEGAVMPKAYIEKVGEEEFRRKPIGSGPWRFVRSVPGDRIEFEAVDYSALARHAAFQEPAHPAGAGGKHAHGHGAHRRGGDRLDRPRHHAECLARRARGAVGAGHHAGAVSSSGAPIGRSSRTARSPSRACGRRCRWRSTGRRSSIR